jgi:hypothetical protein
MPVLITNDYSVAENDPNFVNLPIITKYLYHDTA